MTGGQIAALILAIVLLLPGGCFLIFGISLLSDPQVSDAAPLALLVGLAILAVMGLLFWVAFHKRPPPPGTGTTSA
jgi:membrane protein implicated in regulation of membrane protease activity